MHRAGLNVARGLAARADEVLMSHDLSKSGNGGSSMGLTLAKFLKISSEGASAGSSGFVEWPMKRAESFGEADWA
jgi:hypothetical protein